MVIDNFQLNEEQIAYVKVIPEELLEYIGFQTTTSIASKQEIKLVTPDVYQDPIASKRGVRANVQGGGTWPWGDPPDIKLTFTITIGF